MFSVKKGLKKIKFAVKQSRAGTNRGKTECHHIGRKINANFFNVVFFPPIPGHKNCAEKGCSKIYIQYINGLLKNKPYLDTNNGFAMH